MKTIVRTGIKLTNKGSSSETALIDADIKLNFSMTTDVINVIEGNLTIEIIIYLCEYKQMVMVHESDINVNYYNSLDKNKKYKHYIMQLVNEIGKRYYNTM